MSDQIIYVYSQGPQGAGGSSFRPDASGVIADIGDYDDEDAGFSYLATDEAKIYFREGVAGNWTAGFELSLAPEMQAGLTDIQWRVVGDATWTDLISIADITGPAGTGDADLERDVTAMLAVGNVAVGQVLASGTSFTETMEAILLTTFSPTFTEPTYGLSAAGSASQESGTTYTAGSPLRLTYAYNRGLIKGKLVGGVWSPTTTQYYRGGPIVEYIINSVSTGTTNYKDIATVIEDGTNTFTGSGEHSQGPQPTDSNGDNYGTPDAADTVSKNAVITGRRKAFYGVDDAGTTSSGIRALTGSTLNPSNGTSFTISIPIGSTSVLFAYPATLQDVSSVTYTEGLGADITSNFAQTTVSVEGANSYTGINYKVYRYEPVEAYSAVSTYVVTI